MRAYHSKPKFQPPDRPPLAEEIEQRKRDDALAESDRLRRAGELFRASLCPKRHVANLAKVNAAPAKKSPQWFEVRDLLVKRAKLADGFLVALVGQRGVGKTELATSVVAKCCGQMMTCRYTKAYDLFRDVRRAYGSVEKGERQPSEYEIVQAYMRPDVLVIDELQQRGETDAEHNLLTNLLDHRYDDMLCTILIANDTAQGVTKSVGGSVVSRIHESGECIDCNWPTFRHKGQWNDTDGVPLRAPSGKVGPNRIA